jgi:two-component system, chemotaxis family, sensor kinase CheA
VTVSDKARLELLAEFQQTTLERLERISLDWIALEKNQADQNAWEELSRELHTLKGEAKMMGFSDVSLVAHRMEELLIHARTTNTMDRIADLVLEGADSISSLVRKKAGDLKPGIDLSSILERFSTFIAKTEAPNVESPEPSAPVLAAEDSAAAASAGDLEAPARGDRTGTQPFVRVDATRIGQFSESVNEIVISFVRLEHSARVLRDLSARAADVLFKLEFEEVTRTVARSQLTSPARDGSIGQSALAALRDLQTKLEEVADSFGQQVYNSSVVARELDYEARQLRLLPIQGILSRSVRTVRDLAREHGKEATAEILNTAVVVDKYVLDRISEPLLHLLRNAVDHGIEPPAERKRLRKTPQARISVSASQDGGYVTLAVADDGAGIDVERVRRRAVELGMISETIAAGLSDEEALGLLFRPGFSTRTVVTETSGRGVGLDVVKRHVELLGGGVRVQSTPNVGTRFEIRVPVSIALTRVLIVRAGSELYAIPANAVDGVLEAQPEDFSMVHNRRTVRARDAHYPVTDLARLLGVPDVRDEPRRLVLIRHERATAALAVHEWFGDTEVVVKPLGELMSSATTVSGACVLREGQLAIVLNPWELVARALGELPRVRSTETVRVDKEVVKILLVEDSAIARGMIARILRSLGYEVVEAVDGLEALEHLKGPSVSLILTDIDMPRMNGIELIRRVRTDVQPRNIPIVVLSTRGHDEDKRKAVAAGADAYLVKTEFSESVLKEVIGRQLGGA